MKINPKSQKGAITLVVLIAMVFLISILMSMYIRYANKAQASAENTKQIAQIYNNINEANEIYNNYFSDGDIVPIYTRTHLEKIGSEEQVLINGKVYTFSSDAYYAIQNDINLGGYYDETLTEWTASENDEWEPLPLTDEQGNQFEFTGILDGLGHTISGLYIDNEEGINQGLFGTLKGTVKNLNFIDGYIKGQSNIGIVAGTNEGKIENCSNSAMILALTADDGKIQVDGIWYDSLENYINKEPILITFSINDVTYSAPKGYDWEAWHLDEKYNKLGEEAFSRNDEEEKVLDNANNRLLDSAGVEVLYSDIIKENEVYNWGQQVATTEEV